MQDDTKQRREYRPKPSAQGVGRDALHDAIAQEEALFTTLETQQAESRHRLTALRAELAALDTEPEVHVPLPLALEAPIPRTPAEKVRLFRSLFRGREDIFPWRSCLCSQVWSRSRSGRSERARRPVTASSMSR